jgi:quercetin dioxygenase-like cupin family protein
MTAKTARRGTAAFCLFLRSTFKLEYGAGVSAFSETASLERQQIWEGVVGRTIHGERVTLSVIELDPGTLVPEHAHENEQLGVLLLGGMRFTVGGESRDLGPGATWRILGNVPHSVAVGPEGAVVVEVFSPVRGDWQALEQQEPRPGRWP